MPDAAILRVRSAMHRQSERRQYLIAALVGMAAAVLLILAGAI